MVFGPRKGFCLTNHFCFSNQVLYNVLVKSYNLNSGLAGQSPRSRTEAGPCWKHKRSCSQTQRQIFHAKMEISWLFHSAFKRNRGLLEQQSRTDTQI